MRTLEIIQGSQTDQQMRRETRAASQSERSGRTMRNMTWRHLAIHLEKIKLELCFTSFAKINSKHFKINIKVKIADIFRIYMDIYFC